MTASTIAVHRGTVRRMPSPDELPPEHRVWDDAVLEAGRLAQIVHEYDQLAVARIITHLRRAGKVDAVLVALAAMVDVDQPMSNLLGWIDEREADRRIRRPWQRDTYPPCDPTLDESPASCGSAHGTPGRYNAGCRGEGCALARADYDTHHWEIRKSRQRTPAQC